MQLAQLLKKYNLTVQQLHTLLSKNIEVPNLRLVREVPVNWEAFVRQEMGMPQQMGALELLPAEAERAANPKELVAEERVAVSLLHEHTPDNLPLNQAGIIIQKVQPSKEVSPNQKKQFPKLPGLKLAIGPQQLKIGQLVEIIEGTKGHYGRICEINTTEKTHLPGSVFHGNFPERNTWLLFADRLNKKNPALRDIHWAAPLGSDLALLCQTLALVEDSTLSSLLASRLGDDVREVVATELLNRLAPAADDTMLMVTVRTVNLVKAKCSTINHEAVKAVVLRAAPEYQWQLWLRYCSPLIEWPAVAERLASLFTDASAVVADWWPTAEQTGTLGLYLAYVNQIEADPTSAWLRLKQALGTEQAATYHEVIQVWAAQLEAVSSAADYLRYQQVLRTATGDKQTLEEMLTARLLPSAALSLWLAGEKLPFPRAEALVQFGTLPAADGDRIAVQLTDAELGEVAHLITQHHDGKTRQRARELLNELILHTFSALALDLETDWETIREVAWGQPGSWHTGQGKEQVAAVLQELDERATSSYLAVGHNVRDFDAPVLAAHGVALAADKLWDTLLVEMALSPYLYTYALRTAHTAAADAELVLRLFVNQVQRLLRLEASEWEMLQALFAPPIQTHLADLRTKQAGAAWLADAGEELGREKLEWLRPQPAPSALLAQVQAQVGQAGLPPVRLVLAPAEVWDELSKLSELWFWADATTDLEYQELDAAAVGQQLSQQPTEATWAARFFAYCQRAALVPTAAAMPPAMRVRLRQHMVLADCLAPRQLPGWQAPQCTCLTLEQLLANQGQLLGRPDVAVIVVEPDLLTLGHKKLLREGLRIEDLLASQSSRTEWIKFSGGQSFVSLTREQAIELRAEAPAGYEWFWLEKNRQGSFRVWGSFGWEALAARIGGEAVYCAGGQERIFPKEQLHCVAIDAPRLQQRLGVTPFNPESIYRARYWLLQAELVASIGRRGRYAPPLVLLATRPEEVETLAQYFQKRGYFVPSLDAPLARQLELLHDSRQERRLLVAALDQGAALLRANYRGPLELLLDGFALGENYFLAQGSALFERARLASGGQTAPQDGERDQGGETATAPADQEEEVGSEDDADAPAATDQPDRAKQEYLARDGQFLLHLQRPLVQRWQALAHDNHPDNRLWLLDPRLHDTSGLAQAWRMQQHVLDTPWSDEKQYQADAQAAEQLFGGGQPAVGFTLDLEEAKQLLALAFLQFREQGQWVQKTWREEQVPYLHKILPAQTSLLVSLPTGGGKSLLFQGPALYRSAYTNRLSIVVTPLKALMEDQVAGLWNRGFYSSVEYLNQDKQDEVQQIYSRLAGGEIMLLFITPERFRSRGFARAFEQRLASDGGLEYAIFDEAHCISQWGHEFRPDYLHAARVVEGHRQTSRDKFPVLLFSATVTEKIYEGFTQLFS